MAGATPGFGRGAAPFADTKAGAAPFVESKCIFYAEDTQVCMFFGGFKKISEINRGDIVIDDKFYPMIVMNIEKSICKPVYIQIVGREKLRISPDGALCMHNAASCLTKVLTIEETGNLESHWRDQYKLMSTSIQYRPQTTRNDPYLVGLVVGSRATQVAQVVRDYFINRVDLLTNSIKNSAAYKFTQVDKGELKGILKDKVIPDEYMFGDTKCRHMILRGFIDSRKTSRVKRASSAERKRAVPRVARHTRSKSTVRRPMRSSSDLRKLITPSASAATTATATPVSTRSVSEHDSDDEKSETSVQKIINSKIPVLRRKEVVYEMQNPVVGEQMKTLIRSLGYDCVYIDGELTIYAEMHALLKPPTVSQRLHTFKIVEIAKKEEVCYGLVFDKPCNIILSNYIIAVA